MDDGILLSSEFHRVQRKMFCPDGPQDYFYEEPVAADVPNPDVTGVSLGRCQYRFWSMGNILTAAIQSGFTIARLGEHPDRSHPTIPGSFTLLAYA